MVDSSCTQPLLYKVGDCVQVHGLQNMRDGAFVTIREVYPDRKLPYYVLPVREGVPLWLCPEDLYFATTRYEREVLT